MPYRLLRSLSWGVFFSVATAYAQIESLKAPAQPEARAAHVLAEKLAGVQAKAEAETTSCTGPKGTLTFGHAETTYLGNSGSCYQSGVWADIWTFSVTVGARVRVAFSAASPSLATIQDFTSGTILAASSDSCGGLVRTCTFEYTIPRSGQYYLGFGSVSPETYTLTLSLVSGGGGGGGINLTPYKPDGWSDKIVVSNVTGTHVDSTDLQPSNTLYVDWALINSGTGTRPPVSRSAELYVDGVLKQYWYDSGSLEPNYYSYDEDYSIGSLSAGTHILKLVADPDNEVSETNENDNSYTKTITVGSGGSGICNGTATTLCLNDSRFAVTVNWSTTDGRSGQGQASKLTDDTGYFWFFNYDNLELCVKVLDGRGSNGHFWVFYGALSNVQFTITVTDTLNWGAPKTYVNPQGTMASFADTSAF